MYTMPVGAARSVGVGILRALGATDTEAHVQTEQLIEGDLRGHASHGLRRLPMLVQRIESGRARLGTSASWTWRTTSCLDVDGHNSLGPPVGMDTISRLSERAKKTGVAVGCCRRTNHMGMLAPYVELVTGRGQIGIAMSSTEPLVRPWNGTEALLGTSPIAIGVPTGDRPFVLDLATGLVSMGKLLDHAERGHPIPSEWAVGPDGQSTTDAVVASAGAITPFGGGKGYGLSLAFALMISWMTHTSLGREITGTLTHDTPATKGDVFIVLDSGRTDPEWVARVQAYLKTIRTSPRLDATQPIRVPGDRAYELREYRLRNGLELAPTVVKELRELQDHYCGVS